MRDEAGDRNAEAHGASRDRNEDHVQEQRHWSLSIRVPHAHVEQLAARLLRLGFSALEERPDPGGACVLVYAESEGRLRDVERELLGSAAGVGAFSCEIAEVSAGWQLGWTEHLGPVQLTAELHLVPGAPPAAPAPGAIYLERAFAFGFGEHASTRLIAAWVEATCRQRRGASLLDVGCGTGVLALVAARSGAERVLGVDTSLEAVQAATRNAALNRVQGVQFVRGSAGDVAGRFDIVTANIEAPVLIALRRDIVLRLAAGGALALAGLIEEQAEEVVSAYAALGVQLVPAAREGEWCLLATR